MLCIRLYVLPQLSDAFICMPCMIWVITPSAAGFTDTYSPLCRLVTD